MKRKQTKPTTPEPPEHGHLINLMLVRHDEFENQTIPRFEVGEFVRRPKGESIHAQIVDRFYAPTCGWRYGLHYVSDNSTVDQFIGGGYCYWSNEYELEKLVNPVHMLIAKIWQSQAEIAQNTYALDAAKVLIHKLKTALKVIEEAK